MSKNEILNHIKMVCNTLDGGITVCGVQNAGNLAGCYSVLKDVIAALEECQFMPIEHKEEK